MASAFTLGLAMTFTPEPASAARGVIRKLAAINVRRCFVAFLIDDPRLEVEAALNHESVGIGLQALGIVRKVESVRSGTRKPVAVHEVAFDLEIHISINVDAPAYDLVVVVARSCLLNASHREVDEIVRVVAAHPHPLQDLV